MLYFLFCQPFAIARTKSLCVFAVRCRRWARANIATRANPPTRCAHCKNLLVSEAAWGGQERMFTNADAVSVAPEHGLCGGLKGTETK